MEHEIDAKRLLAEANATLMELQPEVERERIASKAASNFATREKQRLTKSAVTLPRTAA